jgi:hypothetical protein
MSSHTYLPKIESSYPTLHLFIAYKLRTGFLNFSHFAFDEWWLREKTKEKNEDTE